MSLPRLLQIIEAALSAPEPTGRVRSAERRQRLQALQKLVSDAWLDTGAERMKAVLAEHCGADACLGGLPGYKKTSKGNALYTALRRIEQALLPGRDKEPAPNVQSYTELHQTLRGSLPQPDLNPQQLAICAAEIDRLTALEALQAPHTRLDISGDALHFLPSGADRELYAFQFDLTSYYYWNASAPSACLFAWGNALEWQRPEASLFDEDPSPNVSALERLWALRPDEVWCNLCSVGFLTSAYCPTLERQARQAFGSKRGDLRAACWLRLLRLQSQGARLLLLLPAYMVKNPEYAPLRLALQKQTRTLRLFDLGEAFLCWAY